MQNDSRLQHRHPARLNAAEPREKGKTLGGFIKFR
jgi:hypothetical protein